jgi:hypothetical protein
MTTRGIVFQAFDAIHFFVPATDQQRSFCWVRRGTSMPFGYLMISLAILATLPDQKSVEEIFIECHAVASRLRSVDFVFSFDSDFGRRTMRLREQNGKYRADAFFGTYVPGAEEGDRISTFDADVYQQLNKNARMLVLTRAPKDAILAAFDDPLLLAYNWVLPAGNQAWFKVKSLAAWLERATISELEQSGSVRGVDCHRIRVKHPLGNWTIVEIAKHSSFPLGWTAFAADGTPRAAVQVVEWKEYRTPEGQIFLPTKVENQRHAVPGEMVAGHWVYTIDVGSVRINPQLDENLFTISPTRAAEIHDMDKLEIVYTESGIVQKHGADGLPISTENIAPRVSESSSFAIWLLVGSLFSITLLAWYLRRTASRSE